MEKSFLGMMWEVSVTNALTIHMCDADGKPIQPVSIDEAWWIVNLKDKMDGCHRLAGHYLRRRKLHQNSHESICLRYSDGMVKKFKLWLNGDPIPREKILRVSFFARTDAGTLVVSYLPMCAHEASPLIATTCRKFKKAAALQHLAAFWIIELEGQIS